MNRTEFIVATAIILLLAFAAGWFTYWLLHRFTRVAGGDVAEMDKLAQSLHEAEWQGKFLQVLRARPEVLEAHRLAGDIDYLLKVRVKNARAYDLFYQALISEVKIFNVTALLSMEEIKSTTALPL